MANIFAFYGKYSNKPNKHTLFLFFPVRQVNGFFELGDNCIQNFHLGRYIVRYKDRNLV